MERVKQMTKKTTTVTKTKKPDGRGRPKQSKYRQYVVAFAKLFGPYLKSYFLKRVF